MTHRLLHLGFTKAPTCSSPAALRSTTGSSWVDLKPICPRSQSALHHQIQFHHCDTPRSRWTVRDGYLGISPAGPRAGGPGGRQRFGTPQNPIRTGIGRRLTSTDQERELEWLLQSLQDSLAALRDGLHECAALLEPKEPGSTLVLSSLRSENVKGFVTRVGTKIVKGVGRLMIPTLRWLLSRIVNRISNFGWLPFLLPLVGRPRACACQMLPARRN